MNTTLIILIVVIALVGGALACARFSRSGGAQSSKASQDAADFPPKPKWQPTVSVDIPRTIQTFAYYTDRKKAFAVFTHGTCVLLPEGSKDAEKDAKRDPRQGLSLPS